MLVTLVKPGAFELSGILEIYIHLHCDAVLDLFIQRKSQLMLYDIMLGSDKFDCQVQPWVSAPDNNQPLIR